MANREIKVNPNGGPVSVTLTIGQAASGKFGIYVFDGPGSTNFRVVGTGNQDKGNGVPLIAGAAAELVGKVLAWDAVIAPLSGKKASVFLVATQDGHALNQFLDETTLTGTQNKVTIRTGALFT